MFDITSKIYTNRVLFDLLAILAVCIVRETLLLNWNFDQQPWYMVFCEIIIISVVLCPIFFFIQLLKCSCGNLLVTSSQEHFACYRCLLVTWIFVCGVVCIIFSCVYGFILSLEQLDYNIQDPSRAANMCYI